MSAHIEEHPAAEATAPAESYDRVLKADHWATLLLIAAIYIAIWGSHAAATKEEQAVLVKQHRSIGSRSLP